MPRCPGTAAAIPRTGLEHRRLPGSTFASPRRVWRGASSRHTATGQPKVPETAPQPRRLSATHGASRCREPGVSPRFFPRADECSNAADGSLKNVIFGRAGRGGRAPVWSGGISVPTLRENEYLTISITWAKRTLDSKIAKNNFEKNLDTKVGSPRGRGSVGSGLPLILQVPL